MCLASGFDPRSVPPPSPHAPWHHVQALAHSHPFDPSTASASEPQLPHAVLRPRQGGAEQSAYTPNRQVVSPHMVGERVYRGSRAQEPLVKEEPCRSGEGSPTQAHVCIYIYTYTHTYFYVFIECFIYYCYPHIYIYI